MAAPFSRLLPRTFFLASISSMTLLLYPMGCSSTGDDDDDASPSEPGATSTPSEEASPTPPAGTESPTPAPEHSPTPPVDASATPEASTPADTPEPTLVWADMDRDQRMAYMQEEVYPYMKAKFSEFNAIYTDSFTCATCHGADYYTESVDYAMPNPANLEYTSPGDGYPGEIDWSNSDETYQEYITFMYSVRDDMAELLDYEVYSTSNPDGFGCGGCHPSDSDDD